ncbi:MAG: MarR family winged helix-turn-helix transcriptional regulator [Alphaproteobacteria bacterium]
MTDVYSKNKLDNPGNPDALSEESLRQAIEMLFFAYRDFTSGPDEILTEYGFGRAHHRAIYFVGRNSGLTVSALLDILKITKQSLNRVLSQLIREGFIEQTQGSRDRRQRLLSLTEMGKMLEERLTENQRQRIAGAYTAAGIASVDGFRKVLLSVMSSDDDRQRFE